MGTQARRRREFAQPFSGFIQTIVSEEKEKSSLEFTCLAGHSFLEVTTDGHANSSRDMLSNYCNVPDVS